MKRRSEKKQRPDEESRRRFLRQLGLIAGATVVPGKKLAGGEVSTMLRQAAGPDDREICEAKFRIAARESLAERPIGEVVAAIGTSFLGTPYEAHTLEAEGEEHLVVNLRGLDCVTFVENSLALSRCIKLGEITFADFRNQLRLIRYRNGEISGYPSRLHYFSDWIADNDRKGVVRDITAEIGGIPSNRTIEFMSTHRSSYRQLGDDSTLEEIRRTEADLNDRTRFSLPTEKLAENPLVLQTGDIIGITTAIEGLDIIHTGIVVHANGVVKYLHAPLSTGAVQITQDSLVEYLQSRQKNTGIMAARPLEPESGK